MAKSRVPRNALCLGKLQFHDKQASSPSVIKGASLLIVLQIISRLVTFIANQLLLRFLTAPLLGLSAQLEVYYLSVLFFSRESLRVAIQRQNARVELNPGGDQNDVKLATRRSAQAIINLGYVAVAVGLIVSIGLGWLYLTHIGKSSHQVPYHSTSLYLYGAASVIELLAEPCFVLFQTRLEFGTRATAESLATFLRCMVVIGAASWATRQNLSLGLLPFALGQLTYGIVLFVVYVVSGLSLASSGGFSLFPHPVASSGDFFGFYLYRPTLTLARSMMVQSVVKHLLTQGDTFLISLFSNAEIQGHFALANNYGGLLARLLFQPVEESSRSYFSNLLSTSSPIAVSKSTANRPTEEVKEASKSFCALIRLYVILSALVVALGPFASPSFIAIVAGQRWALEGAGGVLAAFCFYIPFIALNGITESFVASVASETDVHKQSFWMGAFSITFAASAFIFMRVVPFGAQGLVLANILNMLCRIVWSFTFIQAYFRKNNTNLSVKSLIPAGTIVLALSTLFAIYQFDSIRSGTTDPITTLVKIAGHALPLVVAITVLERRFISECIRSIACRNTTQK